MADESKPENILDVIRRLTEHVEQLQAENTRLKKRIEELERKKNKYVAPHSREQPNVDPKPAGRRAGEGNFNFKSAPAVETITRRVEVAAPNRCPYCDSVEPLIFKTSVKAYITDLPAVPQPEISVYSVPVMECPACERSVRASHPDLAENQGGATAHRLGARLHAVTQVLRYEYGLPERKIPGVLELLTGAKITQSAINVLV